jgi:predicted nuclease of predicted toxin-antitoxin system
VNFLVDAQLPPGLVQWLTKQGHSAEHVDYCGLTGADDSVIWVHAVHIEAIIITKDEDFADRTTRTETGPTIVWLRIGNSTNRALLSWLEPRWPMIITLLESKNRLIEVR